MIRCACRCISRTFTVYRGIGTAPPQNGELGPVALTFMWRSQSKCGLCANLVAGGNSPLQPAEHIRRSGVGQHQGVIQRTISAGICARVNELDDWRKQLAEVDRHRPLVEGLKLPRSESTTIPTLVEAEIPPRLIRTSSATIQPKCSGFSVFKPTYSRQKGTLYFHPSFKPVAVGNENHFIVATPTTEIRLPPMVFQLSASSQKETSRPQRRIADITAESACPDAPLPPCTTVFFSCSRARRACRAALFHVNW